VARIGIQPRDSIAKRAGTTVDSGVTIDSKSRTSQPCIYAAGDCATKRDPAFTESPGLYRMESVHNANETGRVAGTQIAGWEELHAWMRLERSGVPDGGGIAAALDYGRAPSTFPVERFFGSGEQRTRVSQSKRAGSVCQWLEAASDRLVWCTPACTLKIWTQRKSWIGALGLGFDSAP
jgi:hypothetical protein